MKWKSDTELERATYIETYCIRNFTYAGLTICFGSGSFWVTPTRWGRCENPRRVGVKIAMLPMRISLLGKSEWPQRVGVKQNASEANSPWGGNIYIYLRINLTVTYLTSISRHRRFHNEVQNQYYIEIQHLEILPTNEICTRNSWGS